MLILRVILQNKDKTGMQRYVAYFFPFLLLKLTRLQSDKKGFSSVTVFSQPVRHPNLAQCQKTFQSYSIQIGLVNHIHLSLS